MTSRALLIAVICGLLSALMLAAPMRFGGLGVTLFLFSATPVAVAALGFGTIPGIVAGVIGALAVSAFAGLAGGLSVLAYTLAPAVWGGHMAGLVSHDEGHETWFPLSTILTRLAYLACAAVIVTGLLQGIDTAAITELAKAQVSEFFSVAVSQNPQATAPTEAEIGAIAEQVAGLFPVMAPALLLVIYCLNLSVGASIARARGWMLRPKDDIPTTAAVELPLLAVFAAGLVAAFMGGPIGLVGKVVAGGTGGALMLVGFATFHHVTRGFVARGLVLGLTWFFTLFTTLPAFFMVALGLAETLFGLRAKRGGSSNKT